MLGVCPILNYRRELGPSNNKWKTGETLCGNNAGRILFNPQIHIYNGFTIVTLHLSNTLLLNTR